MISLRPVPMVYQGTRFRSTLEADWACTFDAWGIAWQYEPETVLLPSGVAYLPDFYLPEQGMWAEVKGPHDERLDKTRELAAAVRPLGIHPKYEGCGYTTPVIVLRPSLGGFADWESVHDEIWQLDDQVHPYRWTDRHDRNWYSEADRWGFPEGTVTRWPAGHPSMRPAELVDSPDWRVAFHRAPRPQRVS